MKTSDELTIVVYNLRKLAKKSVLWFGKYDGLSVQQIIDQRKCTYLRWIYFNCERISFLDEILDEMGVAEDQRIEKPGVNPELHNIICEEKKGNMSFRTRSHMKKVEKFRKESKEYKISKNSVLKKSVLQSYNLRRI